MSGELSAIEKRALRRRMRLEQNAGKRLETIFTGTGLPTPPVVEEPLPTAVTGTAEDTPIRKEPVTSSKKEAPESPEIKTEEKTLPENTEKAKPPAEPRKRTKKENPNLQLKRDAIESIKNARMKSQCSARGIDKLMSLRLIIAFICSVVFVSSGFDQNVIIALFVSDLVVILYTAANPPEANEPTLVLFAFLSKLQRVISFFRLLFSFIKIFSVFMFFTVVCTLAQTIQY
uniref:Uncharacterized protein n=1 Tax=Vannella robusta TaxID=1487602 RepID=A0A7S4MRJ2_9EUKA